MREQFEPGELIGVSRPSARGLSSSALESGDLSSSGLVGYEESITLASVNGVYSWVMEPQVGLIAGAEALSALVGIPPATLKGDGWLVAIEPPDRPAAAADWERASTRGGECRAVWRFLSADGEIISALVSGRPAPAVEGAPPRWVFVTQVDHRDRQSHDHIASSEHDQRAASVSMDTVVDAVFAIDEAGRIAYANAWARKYFAPDGQPLLGEFFVSAFPALIGTPLETEYHRIFRERTPGLLEAFLPSVSLWFEIRTYCTPLGVVIHLRNIAFRRAMIKRLEAAVKHADYARDIAEGYAHEVDGIIESVTDPLIIFGPDGTVQRINPAMRALYEEVSEIPANQLTLPITAEHLAELMRRRYANTPTAGTRDERDASDKASPHAIQRVLERIMTGESVTMSHAIDMTLRSSRGHDLVLSVCGGPIRNDQGQVIGAVECIHDVTLQREALRERMRAIDLVAHELRTPLTSITLALDIAARNLRKNAPIDPSTLTMAIEGSHQLERMIGDLLAAAHSGHATALLEHPESCDLVDLCAQEARERSATTERPIQVIPTQESLPITVDRMRIRQVVANLLSNAAKYSPPDTPIELRVESRGGVAWIGVRDWGQGVPPEAREKLFEAFYRAPNVQTLSGSGKGLGLGLFLCQQIVHLHGGEIGLEDGLETGSLFWFTLPLVSVKQSGESGEDRTTL